MGSWHGTCAVTHLPIREGEEVRGFILVPSSYGNHYCDDDKKPPFAGAAITYSTDKFHPLSWSFRGTYNDYGSMKVKRDANTEAMLTYFNEEIKAGKILKQKDKTKPPKNFKNFGSVLRTIERGNTKMPFAFIMVHEAVFQAMIKGIEKSNDRRSGYERISLRRDLLDIKNALKKVELYEMAEKLGVTRDREYTALDFARSTVCQSASRLLADHGNNTVDQMFALDHVNKLLSRSDDGTIDNIIDHMQFCVGMNMTRRQWIIQSGAGSQSESYDVHKALAAAAGQVIDKVRRGWLEDTDDVDYVNKHFGL